MLSTIPTANMRIVSGPYMKRTGLVPLMIGVSIGWIFVCLWSCVAAYAYSHNVYWAVVLFASSCAFASFLSWMSYTLVSEAFKTYTFEITDVEAVLEIFDRLRHTKTTSMVLLDDIKFAEYYPYCDSSSLIFHSAYNDMEVPLCPMGLRAQDVLDFLVGRGVRVINVQSDEKFPDL